MFTRNVESLESRTFLSAAPLVATAVQNLDGSVDVVGTKKADDIHVALNADGVHLDVSHNLLLIGSFDLSTVTLLRIDAGKGNDSVHLDANVMVNAQINGNKGNDILVGGGGADVLLGAQGKDSLTGGDGDDQLDGGVASDLLFGGNGNDHLQGGNGKDVLDGGLGNDLITGGKSLDSITGGEGADTFDGADKVWELHDLNPLEDSYTISLNPLDYLGDIWGLL
jgi:Ca2+-binding RTX toxin-like protein